jgi:tRNA threonylcarbamoyladenosine biosynthesis protein TsaE
MKETLRLREGDMTMLAERVVSALISTPSKSARVILLEGDLGAGKTTFTKALAEVLGIEKEEVHSPTFILKKEYDAEHSHFKKLVHIDAYRFTHPSEAKVLRLEEDLLDPLTIVAVEWPSKMKYLKADVVLSFAVIDDETREVEFSYDTHS